MLKKSTNNILNIKSLFYYFFIIFLFFFYYNCNTYKLGQLFYFDSNKFGQDYYFYDFFESIYAAAIEPYENGSMYPPLINLMYVYFAKIYSPEMINNGIVFMRDSNVGVFISLIYTLFTTILFSLIIYYVKKGTRVERAFFTVCFFCFVPVLFAYHRGNSVILSSFFLLLYCFGIQSENKIIKEVALISLALASAIKLTPIIFGILLLLEKRWKEILRLIIYVFLAFFLPFIFFEGGDSLNLFVKNLYSAEIGFAYKGFNNSYSIDFFVKIILAIFNKSISNNHIAIKLYKVIFVFLGIITIVLNKTKWKKISVLSVFLCVVPTVSYKYVGMYLIIPLIMFLDSNEELDALQVVYCLLFVLIFAPFSTRKLNFLENIDIIINGQASLPIFSLSTVIGCICVNFIAIIIIIETICSILRLSKLELYKKNSY